MKTHMTDIHGYTDSLNSLIHQKKRNLISENEGINLKTNTNLKWESSKRFPRNKTTATQNFQRQKVWQKQEKKTKYISREVTSFWRSCFIFRSYNSAIANSLFSVGCQPYH